MTNINLFLHTTALGLMAQISVAGYKGPASWIGHIGVNALGASVAVGLDTATQDSADGVYHFTGHNGPVGSGPVGTFDFDRAKMRAKWHFEDGHGHVLADSGGFQSVAGLVQIA